MAQMGEICSSERVAFRMVRVVLSSLDLSHTPDGSPAKANWAELMFTPVGPLYRDLVLL